MKYYKDKNNKIYAYEDDGSQDNFIKPDLVSISKEKVDEILLEKKQTYIPPYEPTKEELLAQLESLAAKINSL